MVKNDILKKFRLMKKSNTNAFLVENICQITTNHHLNGKLINITNKLTPYNNDLIKTARSYVGSHFEFVLDTVDGEIMVRVNQKFHKVQDETDIMQLKDEMEKNKGSKPKQQKHQTSQVETRASKYNKSKNSN